MTKEGQMSAWEDVERCSRVAPSYVPPIMWQISTKLDKILHESRGTAPSCPSSVQDYDYRTVHEEDVVDQIWSRM